MYKKILLAILTAVSIFAGNANAAPMAYSVNADGNPGDALYLIDLATGADQFRGELFTGSYDRTDTEGLAFSPEPDKTLWGMDDDSRTLFPFSELHGSFINSTQEIILSQSLPGGGNDFGMTFTCDGSLYFTSVVSQSLYRRDSSGTTVRVGAPGALGVNISAIAAIGNPTRLYGLGNGLLKNGGKDSPNLYSIDTTSGVATMIGALSETDEFKYHEAGLDFDSDGVLWAITDRSQLEPSGSQILQINVLTGAAILKATTKEAGYESLAIAPPSECSAPEPADELPGIPTLSLTGSIFAILVLMLAGIPSLRRRSFKAKI